MSADAHCAANKSDQKREVTYKETQRTSPCLAQWKRLEQSESSGQGPAAAAKPTPSPEALGSRELLALSSLLSSFWGGGFSSAADVPLQPSLARSNLFFAIKKLQFLWIKQEEEGKRRQPSLRVGGAAKSGRGQKSQPVAGEAPAAGRQGPVWPSAPLRTQRLAGPPAFKPHGLLCRDPPCLLVALSPPPLLEGFYTYSSGS